MHQSCGILLVATGEKYVEEALPLVRSIRTHHADVPVHLISDSDTSVPSGMFDGVTHFDPDIQDLPPRHQGFMYRDLALELTPFDRTLHIDCDTIIGAPVYELFHALSRFELVVGAAPAKVSTFGFASERLPEETDKHAMVIPRINCGMICYHKKIIEQGFFSEWVKLYRQGIEPAARRGRVLFSDQSVFRKHLWQFRLNFMISPTEFNFRTGAPNYLDGAVRIAHGRPPMGRQKFIEFINEIQTPRLYLPYQTLTFRKGDCWISRQLAHSDGESYSSEISDCLAA